jgi:transcriptional regulator with XRE-family HTH domain
MKSEKEVLIKIGEKLKKLRIEKGYTSYESFAIANDLSRMQYWRIEKGQSNITIRSLLAILKIHKVSLEKFFGEDF